MKCIFDTSHKCIVAFVKVGELGFLGWWWAVAEKSIVDRDSYITTTRKIIAEINESSLRFVATDKAAAVD